MNLKYFSTPEDASNFEPFPLIFSRPSVAYEGNGASLASNQPSFIEGSKGVYGLGVYEQYTNLLTATQSIGSDTNSITVSCTGELLDRSKDFNEFKRGDSSIRGTYLNSVSGGGMSVYPSTLINVVGGQHYTFVGVLKCSNLNATDFKARIQWRDAYDIIIDTIWGEDNQITGDFQELKVSGIAPANAVKGFFVTGASNINTNDKIWWDSGQLIAKPYPLPWILGGTTRQSDTCTIPANEVKKFLNLQGGCIEGLIRVNSALKHASNRTILFTQKNNNLLEILRTSGNQWSLKTTDKDNNSTNTNLTDTTTTNTLIPFTAEYGKRGRIIINGVSSTLTDLSLLSDMGDLFIGGQSASQHTNTNLRGLFFNVQRSLEEMIIRQKFAQANGYFPVDDKTMAFLDLESGIRAYRRVNR